MGGFYCSDNLLQIVCSILALKIIFDICRYGLNPTNKKDRNLKLCSHEKFTEKNYRILASYQHQKICAEFFSVLQEKFACLKFPCIYRKQDFSLLLLMVGLGPVISSNVLKECLTDYYSNSKDKLELFLKIE